MQAFALPVPAHRSWSAGHRTATAAAFLSLPALRREVDLFLSFRGASHTRVFDAHGERTRNPAMQALRGALDSRSGAKAPSRNDETSAVRPSKRKRTIAQNALDIYSYRIIFHSSPPREGALMRRRAGGRRCGARAGETNAPPPPGRRRDSARAALGPPARSSLTAGREACPRLERSGRPKGAATQSRRQGETERQKARPGAVWTPPWSAERRPRSWQQERGKTERLVRRSVLHPLAFRGGKTGPRGRRGRTTAHPAPQRIGAMDALRAVLIPLP